MTYKIAMITIQGYFIVITVIAVKKKCYNCFKAIFKSGFEFQTYSWICNKLTAFGIDTEKLGIIYLRLSNSFKLSKPGFISPFSIL